MKVISKPNADWKEQRKCGTCEAILEVELGDVRAIYHEGWADLRDNSGQKEHFTYECSCEVCGDKILISKESLNPYLERLLQKKYKKLCHSADLRYK